MWTLAFRHHEDRTPAHGYAETREAAMEGVRQKLASGVVLPCLSLVKKPQCVPSSKGKAKR